MTWNTTWPDGSISVKANEAPGLQNTQYITATMGNVILDDAVVSNTTTTKDHIWKIDANLDGRHRFLNMPKFTIAGAATDPVIGASCNGVAYFKEKVVAEAASQQDVQPFFSSLSGDAGNAVQIMQFLTIRAMIVFDLTPNGTPSLAPTADLRYAHNASVDVTTMTSAGGRQFTVNFTTDVPSDDYLVYGGYAGGTSGIATQNVIVAAAALSTVKTKSLVTMASLPVDAARVPEQIWVVVFGG